MRKLTQNLLKSLLIYDHVGGVFTWQCPSAGVSKKVAGKIAGSIRGHGFIGIRIDGKMYRAHRLAWLYVNGRWPSGDIDHIDGNPSNNAISNLRIANHRQNSCNSKKRRDNSSGIKGVGYHRASKKWRAMIHRYGKQIHLGLFPTKEEASNAYALAAKQEYGEYARIA